MPKDKDIRSAFDNPSLGNEDWLQPSESVFENIEKEIYGKKKKKRFPFWWFTAFLLMIGLVYFGVSNFTNSNENESLIAKQTDVTNTVESDVQIASNLPLPNQQSNPTKLEAAINITTATTESNITQESSEQSNEIVEVQESTTRDKLEQVAPKENIVLKNEVKEASDEREDESAGATKHALVNQTNPSTKPNPLPHKNPTPTESIQAINVGPSTVLSNQKNTNFHHPKVSNMEHSNTSPSTNKLPSTPTFLTASSETNIVRQQTPIELGENKKDADKQNLTSIAPLAIDLKSELLNLDIPSETKTVSLDNIQILPAESKWTIEAALGMSFWQFKLNNNYQTALQPADFTHTNGKGLAATFGLSKSISRPFSLNSSLTIERISFESGHNSSITYNPTSEAEQSNSFDLTMASPLGFIESNIVVEREAGELNEATDLVVDLNNSHQVSNVDLNLSLQSNLYQTNKFEMLVDLGLGVNYLFAIQNDLYEFNLSKDNFKPGTTSITADQNELSKTRPYFMLGAGVTYDWTKGNGLVLRYQFKQDFNSVYQSGDFGTLLRRHTVFLGVRKSF